MIAIIKNNLGEIAKICERMHVHSLYVFGSASHGIDFTENSDIDFLYQFKKPGKSFDFLQYDYFDLMYNLEKITGKKVDLVAEEKIKNKVFLARVNKEKIKIYES